MDGRISEVQFSVLTGVIGAGMDNRPQRFTGLTGVEREEYLPPTFFSKGGKNDTLLIMNQVYCHLRST